MADGDAGSLTREGIRHRPGDLLAVSCRCEQTRTMATPADICAGTVDLDCPTCGDRSWRYWRTAEERRDLADDAARFDVLRPERNSRPRPGRP